MKSSTDKHGKTFRKLLLVLLSVFVLFGIELFFRTLSFVNRKLLLVPLLPFAYIGFFFAWKNRKKLNDEEEAAQHLEQAIQQYQKSHPNISEDDLEKLYTLNLEHPKEDTLPIVALLGDVKLVQYALDHGADVNAKDKDGNTALGLAAQNGHTGIVKLMLDAGAGINARHEGRAALGLAAQNGHTEIVKLMLEYESSKSNIDIEKSLEYAAANGHLEIVKLLFKQDVDINAKGYGGMTVLMNAAEHGHIEIVKFLLNVPRMYINAKDEEGWTALGYAARGGHIEIVKLLIGAGAKLSEEEKQVLGRELISAARNGETETVELLLAAGADVNAKNENGGTALMEAARYGHTEIVRILKAAGAKE